MGEEGEEVKEELEPLFDYTRVQPTIPFFFDDTDLEKSDIFIHCKRRKAVVDAAVEGKVEAGEKGVGVEAVTVDGEAAAKGGVEEDDWLPPPPPAKPVVGAEAEKDSTLEELRLNKQELANFAESAHEILEKLVECAKKELGADKPPVHVVLDQIPQPQVENTRPKVVITIQDKNGQQQIRVYKDEKFDRLFKAYAKKVKLNPTDLVFLFDGDKVNPASTPEDLGLEDDDMIEVHHKPH